MHLLVRCGLLGCSVASRLALDFLRALPRTPLRSRRLRTFQHLLGRICSRRGRSRLVSNESSKFRAHGSSQQRAHKPIGFIGATLSLRKVSTSWASATTGFLGGSPAITDGLAGQKQLYPRVGCAGKSQASAGCRGAGEKMCSKLVLSFQEAVSKNISTTGGESVD